MGDRPLPMPVVTALAEFTLRLFVIWIVFILKIRASFGRTTTMKDAKGHGSNKRTSNADAANALASTLKSTQAPVHDAMVGQQVQNAFRNAAAYGPEHESVGQSLRNAAALERDHAAARPTRALRSLKGSFDPRYEGEGN